MGARAMGAKAMGAEALRGRALRAKAMGAGAVRTDRARSRGDDAVRRTVRVGALQVGRRGAGCRLCGGYEPGAEATSAITAAGLTGRPVIGPPAWPVGGSGASLMRGGGIGAEGGAGGTFGNGSPGEGSGCRG